MVGSRRRVKERVVFCRRGGEQLRGHGPIGLHRVDRKLLLLLKEGCLEVGREREGMEIVLRDM